MATGNKGGVFEYYAQQYRDVFARFHIELELRETAGAGDNIKLLQDPKSDIQIAFVTGGISDGKHAPGLLSLGTVYNQPFWLFYSSNEPLDRLSQLKNKRIAVGPAGSGTRLAADQILGKGGVNSETATLLPFAATAAVDLPIGQDRVAAGSECTCLRESGREAHSQRERSGAVSVPQAFVTCLPRTHIRLF